ncbi:MAG: ATP-binding protein [Acetatifactor sp.]|nr:ATP-binding protein [Acetatifactor sp.]
MLLEFSCSNHKSIRDKVLFSTLAGKDNTFDEKTIEFAGNRILRSSVIYGANGSGKSNFIDAISFVKNLVINSINHQVGQGIRQIPHKMEPADSISQYEIQFVTNGIRYMYGFSLQNMLVLEEYLYYVPNGRQARIFDRKGEDFEVGSKFKGKLTVIKDILKPNKLLLSCAANFSSVDEIEQAYRFFAEELVVYYPSNQENWMNYSLYQMHANPHIRSSVIHFMQGLGMGIKDIKVKIDQKKIDASQLPPFLSEDFKNVLLQQNLDAITAKVDYGNFSTDLMHEESVGVRKLFGLLCPLIDIMSHNKVLVCDELESGLHEAILYELIKLFMNLTGKSSSQLIFTTHETGLLNLDIFRRDQIWFTELKTEDRTTDLYSMAELKNVRKNEKYGKGYIAGRYGAIPMLNVDFAKVLS